MCAHIKYGKIRHNMTRTKIYNRWRYMKDKCNNYSSKNYKNCGGKGIKVCDEWDIDFIKFYKWSIENGYSDDKTLILIDKNKDYCPENCKWINYNKEDLTGKRFGKLTVIEYIGIVKDKNNVNRQIWRCKCDCGNEKIVKSNYLKNGNVKSCGCLKSKCGRKKNDKTS